MTAGIGLCLHYSSNDQPVLSAAQYECVHLVQKTHSCLLVSLFVCLLFQTLMHFAAHSDLCEDHVRLAREVYARCSFLSA